MAGEAEADDGDAIRRRQMVDERRCRLQEGLRAAEADVRFIDRQHDQPSAGCVLVRAVPFRYLDGDPLRFRRERHPLRADDAARVAVDADVEIGWREMQDRLPAIVDDADVDRGHIDRRLKLRRLLLRNNALGHRDDDHAEISLHHLLEDAR